jgi:hypothetical protein
MPTFKEQLEKRTDLQHRLAIWEAIHAYLEENFTARDGTPAKMGIKVPGSHQERVAEPLIEDTLQFIEENHIADIKAEIENIESNEVDEQPQQAGETN